MFQDCDTQVRAYLRGIAQDDDALAQKYYAALSPLLMESALKQALSNEMKRLLDRPSHAETWYRPDEDAHKAIRRLHTLHTGPSRPPLLPAFKTANDVRSFVFLLAPEVGDLIPGKGIYAGIWAPKDHESRSLNKIFDLYAAPKDIENDNGTKILLTFNDTVQHVADLRDWCGHDGTLLENDGAVYEAIRQDRTADLEKWFVPTQDALINNLYWNKNAGDLKGTFMTVCDPKHGDRSFAHMYWSCSEDNSLTHRIRTSNTQFIDGVTGALFKDNLLLSCRPVRAELKMESG